MEIVNGKGNCNFVIINLKSAPDNYTFCVKFDSGSDTEVKFFKSIVY